MSEARTTTLIRKAPGRRASDAGRSRLGDLTRPIAKEQRIAPNRKPAVLLGVAGLVVASAIGAALFGLPVRTWFGQDDELRRLETQLGELQGSMPTCSARSTGCRPSPGSSRRPERSSA